MENRDINIGVVGMDRDTHPSLLKENSYIFALNTTLEEVNGLGNGVLLQNEPSNVLCTTFKEGYKVVGYKANQREDRAYFFLHNEDSGVSEIGYIDTNYNKIELDDDVLVKAGCTIEKELAVPLEDIEYVGYCEYTTLLSDECNHCLGFSIDNPIHPERINIKMETCGTVIQWTDGNNPPRYIEVENIDKYKYSNSDNDCKEEVLIRKGYSQTEYVSCPDCEKMKIFKKGYTICLESIEVQSGGNLKEGVYEILVAPSDKFGNEIGEYTTHSNPIKIIDNNTIVRTNNEPLVVGKTIKVGLEKSPNIPYYKVAVVYKSFEDSATGVYISSPMYGGSEDFILTDLTNFHRGTYADIYNTIPYYESSDIIGESNGYLFHGNVKEEETINLQPVANLMGSFLEWQSYVSSSELYSNIEDTVDYMSYMRGEYYPFSVSFIIDGKETNNFLLINRPLTSYEQEDVVNGCIDKDKCEDQILKRWMVEDTSTKEGSCGDTKEITKEGIKSCKIEKVVGSYTFTTPEGFQYENLDDYIEDRGGESTVTSEDVELKALLETDFGNCDITGNCEKSNEEPIDKRIKLLSYDIVEENLTYETDIEDIDRPKACATLELNEKGKPILEFVSPDFDKEYYMKIGVTNNKCKKAKDIIKYDEDQPILISFHLEHLYKDTEEEMYTDVLSKDIKGYGKYIHKNAVWYKGTFSADKLFLQLSRFKCDKGDGAKEYRISIYSSCSSELVHSYTSSTSRPLTITLNKEDYQSGEFYVAIDTPLSYNKLIKKFTSAAPCGCANISYSDYEVLRAEVKVDNLVVEVSNIYDVTCTLKTPVFNEKCGATPFDYGKLGVYESEDVYPNNSYLYDSSILNISPTDFSDSKVYDVLESLYGKGILEADFRCKNIRHYRMPENTTSPFITTRGGESEESYVYPIGVKLRPSIVSDFLDIAVNNGLLTERQRGKITSYKIYRGDRRGNKTVFSKGLLYDMYKYQTNEKEFMYPNYPYNDLGKDVLNYQLGSKELIPHPYGGDSNDYFSYISPEVMFNNDYTGSYLFEEGYQHGYSQGVFNNVKDHAKHVVLGKAAIRLAGVLATAEVLSEVVMHQGQWAMDTANHFVVGVSSSVGVGISIAQQVAMVAALMVRVPQKIGIKRYEWLQTFDNNGTLQNFAYYYTSVGNYNNFSGKFSNEGFRYRDIKLKKFLKTGRYSIYNEEENKNVYVNNWGRESYLMLGVNCPYEYKDEYKTIDNNTEDFINSSRTTASIAGACDTGLSRLIVKNIASPYVSMRTIRRRLYGGVHNIKWIGTGNCVTFNEDECSAVFGGDVYITRFSMKRKMPLFTADQHKVSHRTPFAYSEHGNINPKYWADFYSNESSTSFIFPTIRTDREFDCPTGYSGYEVDPPSKFYLYYYGVPYFWVESELNESFRYSSTSPRSQFYPNLDYIDGTQESNVSIYEDNDYKTHRVFESSPSLGRVSLLDNDFDTEEEKCRIRETNNIIYSKPDADDTGDYDSHLVYRMLDRYTFKKSNGKLIDIKGIASTQVLARFENTVVIFNAIDEGTSQTNYEIGDGNLFRRRPLEFTHTDLGYGGTQHKTIVSNEFGYYWADAKRGQVFQINPNGGGLAEITQGMRNWFKEHLPFKILRYAPDLDVDNILGGVGLVMAWDSRFRRVFLTKRDYKPKEGTYYLEGKWYSDRILKEIQANYIEEEGWVYLGQSGSKLTFKRGDFEEYEYVESVPYTEDYFEDCGFTLAYSPVTQKWLSYYSFKPNYYIEHYNFFQTGITTPFSTQTSGLWSHLLTNKSYQVFYGNKHDWTIELPYKNQYVNKVQKDYKYWLDVRRYHNEYDYAEKRCIGFNEAVLYNHSENSGLLKLIPEIKNNRKQKLQYPKNVKNGTEILSTEQNKRWSFNYFYNRVSNECNNIPIWLWDCNQVEKRLNTNALTFRQKWLDRLRGDWVAIRLTQNEETRFKFIFKWSELNNNVYNKG